MTYTYLFEDHDNGYGGCVRTYIESDLALNQDLVNEYIRSANGLCGRVGSSVNDLIKGAEKYSVTIKSLKGQHKVDGILENITGNY